MHELPPHVEVRGDPVNPGSTTGRKRSRAGRKSKLTSELQDELCGYIEDGLTNKDAIRLAGTSETRFYAWIDQGEKAKTGKYREFRERVIDARSKFKARHLETITVASRKGGKQIVRHVKRILDEAGNVLQILAEDIKETETGPNVQAAMWLLERCFPEEFSRRQTIGHDGQINTNAPRAVTVHLPQLVPAGEEPEAPENPEHVTEETT